MAIEKGFIKCPERHCSEIAEVMQAGGKRSTLYTKCPACGTNQGNGVARQKYLAENLKASKESAEFAGAFNTVENASIPSKNQGSEVSDDTAPIPTKEPEQIPTNKPKDMPTAPPLLLGVGVLLATIITAIFATRKPTNKPT